MVVAAIVVLNVDNKFCAFFLGSRDSAYKHTYIYCICK